MHAALLPKRSAKLLNPVGTEPSKKNLRESRGKVSYPFQQHRGRCTRAFHVEFKGEKLWANPHQLLLLADLYAKHWSILMAAASRRTNHYQRQVKHCLGYTRLAEKEPDIHANELM